MRLLNLMAGWHRRSTAEGVVLVAPQGHEAAAVQIAEQRRPLRRFKDILDELTAGMAPQLRAVARREPVELTTTIEGEHLLLATITAELADQRVVRSVAMVLAQDVYVLIDGVCAHPAMFDMTAGLVREIATGYYLGLGMDRRRMYRYDVPAGWRGVRRAHSTLFHHPDHPRHGGTIEVFDTRLAAGSPSDLQDRMLFVDSARIVDADPPKPHQKVQSVHGLAGPRVAMTGTDAQGNQVVIHRVTLTDMRHLYIVQAEALQSEISDCLQAFIEILSSIRPVPRKDVKFEAASFIHWSD